MAAGTVIVPVATTTGPVTSGHRYPALNEHTVQVADDIPPYNGSVNADSPLYGVKIALENIDEGLTFNQSERLEKESQHEELRLAEAKEELAENKGNLAAFEKERERHFARCREKNADPKNISKDIAARTEALKLKVDQARRKLDAIKSSAPEGSEESW